MSRSRVNAQTGGFGTQSQRLGREGSEGSGELFIVYPDQLWPPSKGYTLILHETAEYYTKYKFHKQKLAYLRATSRIWAGKYGAEIKDAEWRPSGKVNIYETEKPSILNVPTMLGPEVREIEYHANPGFILSRADCLRIHGGKQTIPLRGDVQNEVSEKAFIWINDIKDEQPEHVGGQTAMSTPKNPRYKTTPEWIEARTWVFENFPSNPGEISEVPLYPLTASAATASFKYFLQWGLPHYAKYKEAIRTDNHVLYHSMLSVPMNVGLITPREVIEMTYSAYMNDPRLGASAKEFLRQQIWREYMRIIAIANPAVADTNFFDNNKRLGPGWYTAQTGCEIVDNTLKAVLATGYCHHIERLMILSAWMLMRGAHPKAAFIWFSEMFMDAYDWVMVGNVYAMGMWSCGRKYLTRPYFSSGAYFDEKSNYPRTATEQWTRDGYDYFFAEKGKIIETRNLYVVGNLYARWKKTHLSEMTARITAQSTKVTPYTLDKSSDKSPDKSPDKTHKPSSKLTSTMKGKNNDNEEKKELEIIPFN